MVHLEPKPHAASLTSPALHRGWIFFLRYYQTSWQQHCHIGSYVFQVLGKSQPSILRILLALLHGTFFVLALQAQLLVISISNYSVAIPCHGAARKFGKCKSHWRCKHQLDFFQLPPSCPKQLLRFNFAHLYLLSLNYSLKSSAINQQS